ncbi:hypothetical protein DLM76_12395 [Leptospira yasudae]|nr:hypothetical protein DLM76_12395 [Leptospira yasudae]
MIFFYLVRKIKKSVPNNVEYKGMRLPVTVDSFFNPLILGEKSKLSANEFNRNIRADARFVML